jgi:hypothetical protein
MNCFCYPKKKYELKIFYNAKKTDMIYKNIINYQNKNYIKKYFFQYTNIEDDPTVIKYINMLVEKTNKSMIDIYKKWLEIKKNDTYKNNFHIFFLKNKKIERIIIFKMKNKYYYNLKISYFEHILF